jgi:hypothetical protein
MLFLTRRPLRTRNWQIFTLDFRSVRHTHLISPFGLYHFHNLKKHVKGRKFSRTDEATLAADGWFVVQTKEFFLGALRKLEQWRHECVCGNQGEICRVNIRTYQTYFVTRYIYVTQVYTCYRNTVFILTLLTSSLHYMFRPPGPSSGESQTSSFYISRRLPTQRIRCFCLLQWIITICSY